MFIFLCLGIIIIIIGFIATCCMIILTLISTKIISVAVGHHQDLLGPK